MERIGQYNVNGEVIAKKSWIPIEETDQDGNKSTKVIPVHRLRKDVTLTHRSSLEVVVLSTYLHQGVWRFKDSRSKTSQTVDTHILSELRRMLGVNIEKAKNLLSF